MMSEELKYLLSLEKDPEPLSPITPGCLGPVTTLFNCVTEKQIKGNKHIKILIKKFVIAITYLCIMYRLNRRNIFIQLSQN